MLRLGSGLLLSWCPGWSLLPLGHKVLLLVVLLVRLAGPEQELQVGVGAQPFQGLRGAITSGVQGFEGHVQGYPREAEGEAQPVQEADLIAQQMSCQQQSADFLKNAGNGESEAGGSGDQEELGEAQTKGENPAKEEAPQNPQEQPGVLQIQQREGTAPET